ncbi:hypothetical protein XENOCAPTIV_027304, partial [Xenoophorus captivus]
LWARALSSNFNKIFFPTVYSIIFTLGIVGNGLVVLVVGYRTTVKTTADKYRLHLSIANLLFVLTLPFWAAEAVATTSWWARLLLISSLSRAAKGQVLKKKKKKALKKMVILVICFFGCWLPYCLGIFVDTLTMLNIVVSSSCKVQQAVETWISVTEALAYFHCCLNPILYAFLGGKFNQTARSMTLVCCT